MNNIQREYHLAKLHEYISINNDEAIMTGPAEKVFAGSLDW